MTYDNRNKGTIAKNSRKTEEKHPDITGQINVDGTDYWINGWQKTNSRDGSTFYSLSVKPKEAKQAYSTSYETKGPARRPSSPAPPADFSDLRGDDDPIPF